jgi:hypothetical protein
MWSHVTKALQLTINKNGSKNNTSATQYKTKVTFRILQFWLYDCWFRFLIKKRGEGIKATEPSHPTCHCSVSCPTIGLASYFKLTPRFRIWCHYRNSSTYWTRRYKLPDNAHLAIHTLQNCRPTELLLCPRTGPVLLNVGNCASRHRDNEAFKLVKKRNVTQLTRISILVSTLFGLASFLTWQFSLGN